MSGETTHEGHRERIRTKFLSGEASSRSDASLLELILTYAIPQRDVRPLAELLIGKFGSLNAVLASEPAALRQVSGIKDTAITLFKLFQHLRRTTDLTPGAVPPSQESPPTPVPTGINETSLPAKSVVPSALLESTDEPRHIGDRKLQVSNGYSLDTAQLARLLSFIQSRASARKISGAELIEGSGLSARQVQNLVSMGTALGFVTPRTQLMTTFGKLVAKHDIFLESITTLEFCHFLAAGSPRHLVWFEIFSDLLATQRPMAQPAWSAWLRQQLAGQYSEASLRKHVAHEVRFILDAYLVRNFKKLNLFTETPEKTYAVRRYTSLQPLTLAAMIYAVGARNGAGVVPFADLHGQPGSLGRIFALDSAALRPMVETLHQREWVRFEVRHGLDQLRLMETLEPLEFIAAAYENRAPQPRLKPQSPLATPLLL